ncbi:MAG TPA: argininosuccinate lyase, partial [Paracoccaceae bacterium]|nr:argininosuccinate lyase [Paracoccaceae bacterium]
FAVAFAAEVGRATALDARAFGHAVAPETFVARRDRPGGPAPAALDAALATYRVALHDLRTAAAHRETRQAQAAQALAAAYAGLMED